MCKMCKTCIQCCWASVGLGKKVNSLDAVFHVNPACRKFCSQFGFIVLFNTSVKSLLGYRSMLMFYYTRANENLMLAVCEKWTKLPHCCFCIVFTLRSVREDVRAQGRSLDGGSVEFVNNIRLPSALISPLLPFLLISSLSSCVVPFRPKEGRFRATGNVNIDIKRWDIDWVERTSETD